MSIQPPNNPSTKLPRLTRSAGFSLIEVLVALVVLAFGLLGVAAIQINALKTNHSAAQRSQATMLAYLMLDAMRANETVAKEGGYNLTKTCEIPTVTGTLAANDMKYWMEKLHEQLGVGTCGAISCDSDGKDRKSTRLNSSHIQKSRMPSSA